MRSLEAWFFDLGGTLLAVEDDEIAVDGAGRVRPLPGVVEHLLGKRGAPVFVVSNQAGIGDGSLELAAVDGYLRQLDRLSGGAIADWRFCSHAKDAGCACRKPAPGLLLGLAARHGIELARATMIGDSENDRRAAAAAGIGRFEWAADFFGWKVGEG
jgi:histidinol-phosphate phosphatase family protein